VTGSKRARPEDDSSNGGTAGADGTEPAPKRARLGDDSSGPGVSADGGSGAAEPAGGLSLEEEQLLLRACELEAWRVCMAAGFDRAVAATAVGLLKRFYVRTRLTDYPPREMM
jgi:hypothetical protein